VYRLPATRFVATFIGSPAMNLIPGKVTGPGVVEAGGGGARFVAGGLRGAPRGGGGSGDPPGGPRPRGGGGAGPPSDDVVGGACLPQGFPGGSPAPLGFPAAPRRAPPLWWGSQPPRPSMPAAA